MNQTELMKTITHTNTSAHARYKLSYALIEAHNELTRSEIIAYPNYFIKSGKWPHALWNTAYVLTLGGKSSDALETLKGVLARIATHTNTHLIQELNLATMEYYFSEPHVDKSTDLTFEDTRSILKECVNETHLMRDGVSHKLLVNVERVLGYPVSPEYEIHKHTALHLTQRLKSVFVTKRLVKYLEMCEALSVGATPMQLKAIGWLVRKVLGISHPRSSSVIPLKDVIYRAINTSRPISDATYTKIISEVGSADIDFDLPMSRTVYLQLVDDWQIGADIILKRSGVSQSIMKHIVNGYVTDVAFNVSNRRRIRQRALRTNKKIVELVGTCGASESIPIISRDMINVYARLDYSRLSTEHAIEYMSEIRGLLLTGDLDD